ncbi:MAG: dockerin type I domain-containing protein [Planctomycetaceae bacterium]|nr:dockerin type I domain-containing protein [Planctomycetaceae bacterium]
MRPLLALLLAFVAFSGASRAVAQSCDLYATDFGSFGGPPDLADGEMRVLWCVNGASITSSNFCATGNALRFDSGSEDPVILISTGALGCTAIEVSFKYAQFSSSGTIVKYGLTNAITASCTASTTLTLGALTATGGACTAFSATIQLGSSKGVYLRFDHGANANAITIDDLVIRRVGCCGSGGHSCCEIGAAGCADASISTCVCAQDPYCCTTEWDAQCVAEVAQFGCGSCGSGGGGGGGGACLSSLSIGFGTLYSGGSICTKFPEIFERCEGTAPFLTSSLGCATSTDMAMRFSQGFPYSAAVTKCVSLASFSAPALAFSYSKQSGTLGPRIDVSLDGTTWATAWTAPVAFEGTCQALLLDLSPLIGETSVQFRFSSGASTSNLAAFDDIAIVETPPVAHGCCEEGGPGCDDPDTSKCACALDAYCCETAWDVLCAAIATAYCGAACPDLPVCGSPTAGECTSAHPTPACADAECCLAVCELDPYCCETAWDAACVTTAGTACARSPDIDGDGVVGAIDLAIVLNHWGEPHPPADLDGDGAVGATDLAAVLSAWTS